MPKVDKIPPLERYIRILETLAAFPDGMSLNDLANILVLPKQSAHRLLTIMRSSGLVKTSGGRGQTYMLGDRIRRLAWLGADHEGVRALATSLLQRLSRELGETCYMAKLEGVVVRSIAMESPDTPWRGFVLPGKILQPHATAAAKAILAYQNDELVRQALSGDLAQLTPKTLTSRSEILHELEGVRERGYSTCIGEVDENLAAIAAPVFLQGIGVMFSVGVVAPLPRILRLIENQSEKLLIAYTRAIGSTLSNGNRRRSDVDVRSDV